MREPRHTARAPRLVGFTVLAIAAVVLLATSCAGPDPVRLEEDLRRADSEILMRTLLERAPAERARAALAMGRIQAASYAGPLAEAVHDPDKQVRLAALFAMGQLGLAEGADVPDVARAATLEALGDDDPEILVAALEALGKLAPLGAGLAIEPFLKHGSAEVRAEAASALFRLRFVPLWRKESDDPPPLVPGAVEALTGALADPDPSVRWTAAHAFSRYGEPEAVDALTTLTRDDDEWARLFAVRAIGRSGKVSEAGGLLEALADPSAKVRTEALNALATLGDTGGLPGALASDPSFHVRAALARALAGATTPDSLETLWALERDESPSVRAAALGALAVRLGDGYREALDEAFASGPWTLRVAAARAAGGLGPGGTPLIRKAMQDDDNRVRAAAVESLGEAEGEDLLLDALGSPDLAVRGTAVSVLAQRNPPDKLERLTAVYDGSAGVEWIEIREAVADAVTDLEGSETLLRRMARDDPASSVRGRAQRILAERGEEPIESPEPAAEPSPFLDVVFDEDPVVLLETSKGEITIRCLAKQAPVHVASFVKLARDGFYDGLIWHRVVSNFVIQGGDPRGDGWGGAGYTLRDEINRQRYVRGTVGMPKAGKDTGGGQIFITHVPTPHLDGNYTVFGLVESGLDVVDRIEVGDMIVRATVVDEGR